VNGRPFFIPARIRGTEYLDDAHVDCALSLRSLRDVRLANRFFGGSAAVIAELRCVLGRDPARELSLLDVGTGAGDIPLAARRVAATMGVTLRTVGMELSGTLAAAARAHCTETVAGDARRLPFGSKSVDIVTCSQVLHHFADDEAIDLLRELHRVARRAVIIGEIRRSWFAAAGLWLASWPLGFHPVSRHDGVVSVLRGYRIPELGALVRAATGADAQVQDRFGFRVTARWRPA